MDRDARGSNWNAGKIRRVESLYLFLMSIPAGSALSGGIVEQELSNKDHRAALMAPGPSTERSQLPNRSYMLR
jgi:hypothetical protein